MTDKHEFTNLVTWTELFYAVLNMEAEDKTVRDVFKGKIHIEACRRYAVMALKGCVSFHEIVTRWMQEEPKTRAQWVVGVLRDRALENIVTWVLHQNPKADRKKVLAAAFKAWCAMEDSERRARMNEVLKNDEVIRYYEVTTREPEVQQAMAKAEYIQLYRARMVEEGKAQYLSEEDIEWFATEEWNGLPEDDGTKMWLMESNRLCHPRLVLLPDMGDEVVDRLNPFLGEAWMEMEMGVWDGAL